MVDTKTGEQISDTLEDERKYESAELEQCITVPDRNMKIVQECTIYICVIAGE